MESWAIALKVRLPQDQDSGAIPPTVLAPAPRFSPSLVSNPPPPSPSLPLLNIISLTCAIAALVGTGIFFAFQQGQRDVVVKTIAQTPPTPSSIPTPATTPQTEVRLTPTTPVTGEQVPPDQYGATDPLISSTPDTYAFNFPQASCGDPPGSGSVWYPVFIDNGDLAAIQEQLCADALPTVRQDTGLPTVQVASFSSLEKAQAFARVVGGDVGSPYYP